MCAGVVVVGLGGDCAPGVCLGALLSLVFGKSSKRFGRVAEWRDESVVGSITCESPPEIQLFLSLRGEE